MQKNVSCRPGKIDLRVFPKISFSFFLKNRFWWVDALERGVGVRTKSPKDALREKIDL